ncbi:MAG: site-specific integrase [Candidatus Nanopelagicales bacterium]
MAGELVVAGDGALAAVELVASARTYAEAATAPNTRRAYASAWRSFTAWCKAQDLLALPAAPATVALYVAHLADAGRAVSSVQTALAAIRKAHEVAGTSSPTAEPVVRQVTKGVRRTVGVAPRRQKTAILAGEIRRMVDALPTNLTGLRNRALLLVGFAGAFRRSELVGLNVEDLTFGPDGLTVALRRSKTDKDGQGRVVGLPFGSTPQSCPVRSLRAYLDAAGVTEGAVFRGLTRHGRVHGRLSGLGVARVVKAAAVHVGLHTDVVAGHSLRSGFATSAAQAGKSERVIALQTGHKSTVVLRRYIRTAGLFTENAAAGLL